MAINTNIIMCDCACLQFTTCLLRHVYMPNTPLTLAWGWHTSGTLSSLFIYDALCEWADGDLCHVHWINLMQNVSMTDGA